MAVHRSLTTYAGANVSLASIRRSTALAMDTSSYSVHPPQTLGQSPFFYYNPDPSPDHRQHGHFTPHPNGPTTNTHLQQFQQQNLNQETTMPFPNHYLYPRTPSSSPQTSLQAKASYSTQMVVTPLASPRPLYQKPTILIQPLDTECAGSDLCFYPSTPPLSSSGSVISSPPSSCGIIPTPTNGIFCAMERFEGVKEGCESDVRSEILAGGDWTRSCSPMMTPGTLSCSESRLLPDIPTSFCVTT